MSGTTQTVITKRTFDFSNLQSGQTQEIPLCRAFDVTGAKQIDLVVRCHSKTITSTGQIDVNVQGISLSGEDPSADFIYYGVTGSIVSLASCTLTASLIAPFMLLSSLAAPWGPMIRVLLKGTGASGATIQAALSIDLIVYDN
jgi:hypothetical protein